MGGSARRSFLVFSFGAFTRVWGDFLLGVVMQRKVTDSEAMIGKVIEYSKADTQSRFQMLGDIA